MTSYKMGMFFTRKFKISEAEPPADVKEAFVKYSDGKNLIIADQLLHFLIEFQRQSDATIQDAERIITQIMQRRHQIVKFTRHGLTLDDFHHFLFDYDLNPAINPQVWQDMTAPLSHYFIYTGHNSYLSGNQLTSDCSDVPIINALKKGVRVIELDIWPSSSKEDVNVLHGRTLTTPVKLRKCLSSIKEYAFCATPYPLVITLEDHLTPKLRVKVAEMLTETFGEMLFIPEIECLEQFPSPEALKHRILISTKPPKEYLESRSIKDKGKDDESSSSKEVMDVKRELEADDSDGSENDQEGEDIDDCDDKSGHSGASFKRLIAIQANKHKGEFEVSLKLDPSKVGRLSLSEPTLEKAAECFGTDLVRFTQRNVLRIYPKGSRLNSSNYDPTIAWMHGAQMVAFNMQGYGKKLWLMEGMFRSNGGCGYVKKPDILMKGNQCNHIVNTEGELPVKKTLKVRVYMGDGWNTDFKSTHFDKYSPPDFYVKMKIFGAPADLIKKKTKTLEDNWKPVWDEEFVFPLRVPELALLRIEVHEYDMSEKDDFAGQIVLPVWELLPGIRAVPLFNKEGEKFKSVKLLMRFECV